MKPRKLSAGEIASIRALGDKKLALFAEWANKQLECSHCGKCTRRCEVLEGPGLDMGKVEAAYKRIMAVPADDRPAAVFELVSEDFLVYNALRQCCFCGFCTAACAHHMLGADHMREWRELFMQAGLMPPDASKIVMVDNEWHIFSAYRAIYGVGYPEYVSLDAAAEQGPGLADTLFFPGCTLVSYAPELLRAVGGWLTDAGLSWALSDDCCGSPLMSAGLFDRAKALRKSVIDRMRAAGIKRMVTVCPGCGEEFAEDMPDDIEIVPLPELLLGLSRGRVAAGEPSGFAPLERDSLTFFDSCHDRFDSRHAEGIRALMHGNVRRPVQAQVNASAEEGAAAAGRPTPRRRPAEQREINHSKRGTLCCGAGGAAASYDADITERRVWRVIDEARATGAQTLVTMCPTCAYTIAQANLGAPAGRGMDSRHYLEMLFGVEIDWALVFGQLESMWTGEYGPWLNQTFF